MPEIQISGMILSLCSAACEYIVVAYQRWQWEWHEKDEAADREKFVQFCLIFRNWHLQMLQSNNFYQQLVLRLFKCLEVVSNDNSDKKKYRQLLHRLFIFGRISQFTVSSPNRIFFLSVVSDCDDETFPFSEFRIYKWHGNTNLSIKVLLLVTDLLWW